jgi:hypothetical protein
MVMNWHFIRKAKELYSWYSFAVGVYVLLVAGIGLAVGGAVWLATGGTPLPLVVMAGFCTLVGAVYLAMAPLVISGAAANAECYQTGRRPEAELCCREIAASIFT